MRLHVLIIFAACTVIALFAEHQSAATIFAALSFECGAFAFIDWRESRNEHHGSPIMREPSPEERINAHAILERLAHDLKKDKPNALS